MTTRFNEAPILDQLEGQWQKMIGLVLFKLLAKGQEVVITGEDMERYRKEWGEEGAVVFTHGRYDSIAFKLVTPEEAQRIAEYEVSTQGHA